MGCDGGTIPKRDELVRTKKKPEQKDKLSELSFKWGHCALTQEPLKTPIVACQLGRLFNKVAVLESLLDRTTLPDSFKYIRNMKDIKELNLTNNPAFKDSDTKGDSYIDNVSPYICPVIGLEMNGKYRFVYFWSCGCVMSERALKAVKTKICHKCQKPFTDEDIIVLNGTEEDVNVMSNLIKERQRKIKEKKKQTKNMDNGSSENEINKKKENATIEHTKGSTSGHAEATQTTTLKTASKRPHKIIGAQLEDPDFKKTKTDYSVAKDPKATEVFKSIFTSHKSAEKSIKAHWITYNPFYN